jgi:RNA polymerase sigma-70 factor, ECF subfamily
LAKNEWRKMKVRTKVHSGESAHDQHQLSDTGPSQERLVDLQQFNASLQKALNQLEEAHREVFLLRYQQDFSIKEISETLQVPEGTVKSRLFYASKKLATMLQHLQNLQSESL